MGSRFPFRQARDRGLARGEVQPSRSPMGSAARPASYNAPAAIQLQRTDYRARLSKTAGLILRDPLLMGRLGDRIYALFQAELEQRSRD